MGPVEKLVRDFSNALRRASVGTTLRIAQVWALRWIFPLC